MLKRRIAKLAVAAVTMASAVGLASLGATAASAATSTHPVTAPAASTAAAISDCSPCFPHTVNGHAPLFRSDGSLWGTLPLNDEVEVTCWYPGNPPAPWHGDGYQDHVVWVNSVGNFTGHIPDYYINFGGLTPNQVGLPRCG